MSSQRRSSALLPLSLAGADSHRLGPYSVEDAVVEDLRTVSTTNRYTVQAPSSAKNIARVTLQLAACEPAQEIVAMSHGGLLAPIERHIAIKRGRDV